MSTPKAAAATYERRLFLAWLLTVCNLPLWENADMVAADALALGADSQTLAQLAGMSQPIDHDLLSSLLDDLANENNWKRVKPHSALLMIAQFCAEDVINNRRDVLDACGYIYDQIYLKLESDGQEQMAIQLQPFVEISISWKDGKRSLESPEATRVYRSQLGREAINLFQQLLHDTEWDDQHLPVP